MDHPKKTNKRQLLLKHVECQSGAFVAPTNTVGSPSVLPATGSITIAEDQRAVLRAKFSALGDCSGPQQQKYNALGHLLEAPTSCILHHLLLKACS